MGANYLIIRCGKVMWLFLLILLISGCGEKVPSAIQNKTVPARAIKDNVVIAGSGSNILVTRNLAESYNSNTNVKIEVPASIGSEGAINAVKSGKIEMGLISRRLTSAEREEGLKEIPYARVAIAFGAHTDVLDIGVSTSDILDILKGSKTTWSNGSKIYVFVRERNDSSNLVLYEEMPGFKDVLFDSYQTQRWEIMYRDSDMRDALEKTKGSFGIVNITDIASTNNIKALEINGIAPTPANVLSGKYKFVKDLSFVYQGQISLRSTEFLDFVFSPEGQQILMRWGAAPLGR